MFTLFILLLWLTACAGAGQVLPEVEPTPEAAATQAGGDEQIASEGLCPEVPRPALVTKPGNGSESFLVVMSLDGEVVCELTFPAPLGFGQIMSGGESLFYEMRNEEAGSITVWQLGPDGTHQPLDFTTTPIQESTLFYFVVSADGQKIAWATAEQNAAAGGNLSTLQVAEVDGSNQVTLQEGVRLVEGEQTRHIEPMRFNADNSTLFYAVQPDRRGGVWNAISGRYDNLYGIPVTGGEAELLADCPSSAELFLCIGDIAPDGSALALVDSNEGVVQIIGRDGEIINSVIPQATNYIGMPTFSPAGKLAFTSATLSEEEGMIVPAPGHISVLHAPYTGQAETVFSDNGVSTIMRWIDDEHLIYFHFYGQASAPAVVAVDDGEGELVASDLASISNVVAVLN
ncbi:MAG: hypothetical protein M3220_11000 [Chloroflexota bacterium]|nr:hypothetical protein [Chloroflexota bacterium]